MRDLGIVRQDFVVAGDQPFAVTSFQLGGAHVREADLPVGLQVMGYGFATSYQVPGGLNLLRIAEPPVIF